MCVLMGTVLFDTLSAESVSKRTVPINTHINTFIS